MLPKLGKHPAESELNMVNWEKIADYVRGYIEHLKDSLVQQGFSPPEWNAIDIAKEAADKAKQQLKGAPSGTNQSAYIVALKEAKHIMVRDLDWTDILSKVASYVRKILPKGQKNQAGDIANDTYIVACKNWDPELETNWAQPGLRFAMGVAWKLAKKAAERGGVSLVFIGDLDALSNPVAVMPQVTHINKKKLVEVINEWLESQPPKKAIAFVLDIVHKVDWVTCGWIAYPKCTKRKMTNNAYRCWWYREREKMHASLREYLDVNRWRYT